MDNLLLNHEAAIRAALFLVVIGTMMAWEMAAPRRTLVCKRGSRWATNLAQFLVNIILVRLAVPVAAVGTALYAQGQGLGILRVAGFPAPIQGLLAVVILDFTIYLQHRLFHRLPWLWRLHRVHHMDMDLDATTAIRFHPFEIILSMLVKMGAVLVIGAPVAAVIIYEIILNGAALFNHGNVRLAPGLDSRLRRIIVTPDMHRVHHSVLREETDSNYGNFLSCWDRLCRSYREQPRAGHRDMVIGLPGFRDARSQELVSLLISPFHRQTGD